MSKEFQKKKKKKRKNYTLYIKKDLPILNTYNIIFSIR